MNHKGLKFARRIGSGVIALLIIALIALLLLVCWAPSLLGEPADQARPHWWDRPPRR